MILARRKDLGWADEVGGKLYGHVRGDTSIMIFAVRTFPFLTSTGLCENPGMSNAEKDRKVEEAAGDDDDEPDEW